VVVAKTNGVLFMGSRATNKPAEPAGPISSIAAASADETNMVRFPRVHQLQRPDTQLQQINPSLRSARLD
jgi:hypothetical protein